MGLATKITLTLVASALLIGILLSESKVGGAGPDWFWRGGNNDLVRRLFFSANGELRPRAKQVVFVFFTGALLILWFLVPSL